MTCCLADNRLCLPKKGCIDRKCAECGVLAVRKHLSDILNDLADKTVTWTTWEMVRQDFRDKGVKILPPPRERKYCEKAHLINL